MRIIVLGYMVRSPLGGLAWHHLQYVLGLTRLGHDVTFVEDSDDVPWSCYDPVRGVTDEDPTYGLRFAARIMRQLGLDRWAYHDAHRAEWHGPSGRDVGRLCAEADVLLDLSLVNPLRPWTDAIPFGIAVDTDPVFNQVRNLIDPAQRARCERHDVH